MFIRDSPFVLRYVPGLDGGVKLTGGKDSFRRGHRRRRPIGSFQDSVGGVDLGEFISILGVGSLQQIPQLGMKRPQGLPRVPLILGRRFGEAGGVIPDGGHGVLQISPDQPACRVHPVADFPVNDVVAVSYTHLDVYKRQIT